MNKNNLRPLQDLYRIGNSDLYQSHDQDAGSYLLVTVSSLVETKNLIITQEKLPINSWQHMHMFRRVNVAEDHRIFLDLHIWTACQI
jgi:hypothetical protein